MLENKKIVIIGGGHAGIEAACAVSRLGYSCCLITLDKKSLGRLSCNPAVGGLAKSHLVYEIDVLGGVMGWASDLSAIQFKTLNKTKGRAVWSTRAQLDKKKYPKIIQKHLFSNKLIKILEDEVVSLKIKNKTIVGVKTKKGTSLVCVGVVITCGTFLNGLIHVGENSFKAGRLGERGSYGLTENLIDLGFVSGRLKTGTPPRISRLSVDFSKVEVAPGDKDFNYFSLYSKKTPLNQVDCYLVKTNKKAHSIIKNNISTSPMFSGKIKGIGPRYCPSIEDKVVRFSEKDSHHLFLEPEWFESDQIYVNGFSTSLPYKVQARALRCVEGLERVEFVRPGYAIEYDFFPPRQLKATLESKSVAGLFFAGQINGTSGYEEAAAQGLVAGINVCKKIEDSEPLILSRTNSYIGVMLDDLITSHLDEPYRMFTSRAEHRLFLRPDNCCSRLSSFAVSSGILTKKQKNIQKKYLTTVKKINTFTVNKKIKKNNNTMFLNVLIKNPKEALLNYVPKNLFGSGLLFDRALFEVETSIKYSGYIKNEEERIKKNISLDLLKIPFAFNYRMVEGLSNESKERLMKIKPETLGQASRIFGVRPTDITILGIYIKNRLVSRETQI